MSHVKYDYSFNILMIGVSDEDKIKFLTKYSDEINSLGNYNTIGTVIIIKIT